MKVAVINFSGNVGKTTVAAHLLKPRMGDATIFSVESLNLDASADGVAVEKLRGRKFGELQDQLMTMDDAIIDIGASNVEEFLKFMQQYSGSHDEFDYFIVPVVKQKKQQGDSVHTIRSLAAIGIPPAKIRLLFNKVEIDDDIEDDFPAMFGLDSSERLFTLNPKAIIYENEVFAKLKDLRKSLGDISADSIDYRAKLREAVDPAEREMCVAMVGIKRLAVTANRNLDAAFEAIFA